MVTTDHENQLDVYEAFGGFSYVQIVAVIFVRSVSATF